jgi:hypothetical protein
MLPSADDALSYVWIGTDSDAVTSAGATETPAGGQLIVADPAIANAVYNDDLFFKAGPATYSSPVLHTVPLHTLI